MRTLIIANIEKVEATPFISAILYDDTGQRLDEIVVPFVNYRRLFAKLREMAMIYSVRTLELWTSDKALYVEALKIPGIAATLKHEDDTKETKGIIERDYELLRELYEIEPIMKKPRAPRWRRFLYAKIRKLLKLIEGNGKYEIS